MLVYLLKVYYLCTQKITQLWQSLEIQSLCSRIS
jgi:hypothetical protein